MRPNPTTPAKFAMAFQLIHCLIPKLPPYCSDPSSNRCSAWVERPFIPCTTKMHFAISGAPLFSGALHSPVGHTSNRLVSGVVAQVRKGASLLTLPWFPPCSSQPRESATLHNLSSNKRLKFFPSHNNTITSQPPP